MEKWKKKKQAHSIIFPFLPGYSTLLPICARIFPSVIEEAVVVVLVLEGKDSLSNELVE